MANRLRLNTKVVQNGHVGICVVPLPMKMHETNFNLGKTNAVEGWVSMIFSSSQVLVRL